MEMNPELSRAMGLADESEQEGKTEQKEKTQERVEFDPDFRLEAVVGNIRVLVKYYDSEKENFPLDPTYVDPDSTLKEDRIRDYSVYFNFIGRDGVGWFGLGVDKATVTAKFDALVCAAKLVAPGADQSQPRSILYNLEDLAQKLNHLSWEVRNDERKK